ncbi:hypothetical protein C6A85_12585, partial [Mycobacterium sp. ITM-2017-0098]
MALAAYRNAETMMAGAYPGCGLSWNLLAGIGRIESMHANGGAALHDDLVARQRAVEAGSVDRAHRGPACVGGAAVGVHRFD